MLKHPIPFIRQLTLEALALRQRGPEKSPMVPLHHLSSLVSVNSSLGSERSVTLTRQIRRMVPSLLKDPDTNVRIAACHLARRMDDKDLLSPVLKVLSKARNRWEIEVAEATAIKLGGQYQVWRIRADRLNEKGILRPAIISLATVIETKYGVFGNGEADETEGQLLQPKWQKFLKINRARLKQGKKFSSEEATWSDEMLTKQFHRVHPSQMSLYNESAYLPTSEW